MMAALRYEHITSANLEDAFNARSNFTTVKINAKGGSSMMIIDVPLPLAHALVALINGATYQLTPRRTEAAE